MSKSQINNGTMKFTDIDPKKVIVDCVTMNGELVPLLKYEDKNRSCVFQGPRICMTDYGLAVGEFLSNGEKNEWYRSDEARDTMKFPLDADKCSVTLKDGTTNKTEFNKFIDFLKALDVHIKTSETIRKAIGIDDDNIEKYIPIFRKAPKPVKKALDKSKKGVEPKVKPAYMKTKFAVNHKNKKEILTEFYNVDLDTNKPSRVVTSGNYITLEDLESFYEYKCDQQPVIQLVKVWTKSNGEWGVTLRLVMSRIRKAVKASKNVDVGFIDDDEETEQSTKQESKEVHVPSDDSDEEPVQKAKINVPNNSDDSDEAPARAKPAKQVVQKAPVQEDSDSEEVVPVKKPTRQPVKKDVESDDSDDEVVSVRKPPVRKAKK